MTPAVSSEQGDVCLKIAAVIVTYFPDPVVLQRLFRAVAQQVTHVLVIDNTPGAKAPDFSALGTPKAEHIALTENLGLAAAQNRGIERARALGSNYVILFDQDSVPEPDMVDALFRAMLTLRERGERVGAVGPRCVDPQTAAVSEFISVRWGRARALRCDCTMSTTADSGESGSKDALMHASISDPTGRSTLRCDYLVASGCLIPLEVLEDVGPMDERLFIDQIDIDWCLRAGRAGYRFYGVCPAVMRHRVGVSTQNIWFFGWRRLPSNPIVRDYYLVRNLTTLLLWRPIPLGWRVVQGKVLCNLLVVALTSSGRRTHRLGLFALGVLHGALGKLGRNPRLGL